MPSFVWDPLVNSIQTLFFCKILEKVVMTQSNSRRGSLFEIVQSGFIQFILSTESVHFKHRNLSVPLIWHPVTGEGHQDWRDSLKLGKTIFIRLTTFSPHIVVIHRALDLDQFFQPCTYLTYMQYYLAVWWGNQAEAEETSGNRALSDLSMTSSLGWLQIVHNF